MPDATSRRTVGRPRRLTLEAIIDAACDIGIANLEMGLIAERLNTGVATLYGYVRGREHLLELVTQRLAGESLVKDSGQSWQDVLREHAAITYKLFQSLPHLITNLMAEEQDRQSVQYSQLILNLLVGRGLQQSVAVAMYIETNQVVIGAAVTMVRRRAAEGMTDQNGCPVPLPAVLGDYRLTMERIITGYEELLANGIDTPLPEFDKA